MVLIMWMPRERTDLPNSQPDSSNNSDNKPTETSDWRSWIHSPVLPRGRQKTTVVRNMFDAIAPRYDLVNRLMTFGIDVHWRHSAIKVLALPPGSRVLDLATGTGDLARMLEQRGIRAIGVDLSMGMLQASKAKAPLVQADGSATPFSEGLFDGAISAFAIRNFSDLQAILSELARIVRPGGRISLLDVSEPHGIMGLGARIWFEKGAPLIGSLLSDKDAYSYLPRSVQYLPSPSEMARLMGTSGFSCVNHRLLTGGIAQIYSATRSSTL
ncbi:MAG: ubiquinone/menaquinone biosynthesis methyltransferase [Actinobacteria bacterium]|jgi:demethylmenaquinone methyltransferase/2-methoxy-6-polyprenyl-1,4-benzoquinol methylase|nr:ubiquinone/menaquinone biosynthesis methyltransferase [Actinomycetota bacterium]